MQSLQENPQNYSPVVLFFEFTPLELFVPVAITPISTTPVCRQSFCPLPTKIRNGALCAEDTIQDFLFFEYKELSKELSRGAFERWGAGVEYHFQESNEPYAPS